MKRSIGLLALVVLLVAPCLAFAEGKAGIYIAPKFIYGATWMDRFGIEGSNGRVMDSGQKTDSVAGGALAIGYDFSKQAKVPVRLEVEGAMFSDAVDKEPLYGSSYRYTLYTDDGNGGTNEDTVYFGQRQGLQIQTLFVNVYYDFRNSTPFSFWLGAGAGMAFIEDKGSFSFLLPSGSSLGNTEDVLESWPAGSEKKRNVAWNVGFGVGYDITSSLTLDVGYRFLSLGKARTATTTSDVFNTRAIDVFGDTHIGKIKSVYMHQLALGLRLTF